MKSWFKDWFSSDNYLKVYDHRDFRDAEKLAQLILKSIPLSRDGKILDAACGAGRHSLIFAENGFNVTGFDLSSTLLLKAKEEAFERKLFLNLVRADIREIQFKTKFDLILNLFTSFGYFESDEENFRFVKNSIEFLNEDGFYVLDFLNKNFVENNLIAESYKNIDGIDIKESRKIENQRVIKKIVLKQDQLVNEFKEYVCLYGKDFIVKQFLKFGYKLVNSFGDYEGSEYCPKTSPRMILIFQK